MILDEVVLHNFGVYRGRQTISLTPTTPHKPVILIGGLNGGGKTTLLDALQLALYGKLARCSARGNLAYEDFLRRSIHRAAPVNEGAALEVQFRQMVNGQEGTYRVHRSWLQNGRSLRERVEVTRNDVFDRVLTESWQECVETFLPARIAPLFFFDGEQIEALADEDHASQVLATAMQGLLGLDLVDQLATDLVALERRKRTIAKNDVERRAIEIAQEEVEQLECQREALVQQRGTAQNKVERSKKQLRDIETRFQAEGGDLLARRNELERQRTTVVHALREAEGQMREVAAGLAPLLMVAELLSTMEAQARQEEAALEAQTIGQWLAERDARLLAEANQHGVTADVLQALDAFLTSDRQERRAFKDRVSYLALHLETREQIQKLKGHLLDQTATDIRHFLDTAEDLQGQLTDIDRQLAQVPDRDALTQLIDAQQKARTEADKAQGHLEALDAELERLTRDYDRKRSQLTAMIERTVEADFEQEALGRVLHHTQRVRETLTQFRSAVLERHTQRIAHLVLESFRHLAHKESLVTALRIDPERFTVELQGKDGRVLSPDRLSAGERQLLAVALLWGLSRASGRPLPAVIDTPLGRLDASHRTHLVERYFPYASHQVILLSTDQEIDEIYYAKLKRWVGRAYRLDFEDALDATHVRSGYFW